MTIYSYVSRTVEQRGWTGVCRADATLRRAIPGLRSVTLLPALEPDDIVITDNHLSLDVPNEIKTIVVHRGCAATHYERDRNWRTDWSRGLAKKQIAMFALPNRIWIAPSAWVADEFAKLVPDSFREFNVIPNWVDPIPPLRKSGRPKIIGDWRDFNKGRGIWK